MSGGADKTSPPVAKCQITLSKLLLVEGKEDERFLAEALEHLGIGGIQILPIAGKDNLGTNLAALTRDPKFGKVTCVAVIRDADRDSKRALQSVRDSLAPRSPRASGDSLVENGFSVPQAHGVFTTGSRRTGVFIMPDGVNPGMLETLCMQSVADTPRAKCVEGFLACLSENGPLPANVDKVRAHAWLAGQSEPGKRLGEAAEAGYWRFENPVFENLWNFLRAM